MPSPGSTRRGPICASRRCARLLEISSALLALDESDPTAVFGFPDDLKLRSSMTLFAAAAPDEPVFSAVLDKFFGGQPDTRTLQILGL